MARRKKMVWNVFLIVGFVRGGGFCLGFFDVDAATVSCLLLQKGWGNLDKVIILFRNYFFI